MNRLLVVPDGSLHYLPFEILPWQRQLLGDIYPVTYAPSATVVEHLRRRWDQSPKPNYMGDFLGFGDPDFDRGGESGERHTAQRRFTSRGRSLQRLPGTRIEVEQIARRFGSRGKIHVGADATEWNVKTQCSGYRYLHFATHGLLDDTNPMYSGLALAPPQAGEPAEGDDMLQVHEMFGMKISAELVVCSACQTGLGEIRGGEGLVGMSRGLFFAGANCLIVSLWSVPDLATAQLMRWFYDGITKNNETIVEALQSARIRMKVNHPDPYFWAAFVVLGEPNLNGP